MRIDKKEKERYAVMTFYKNQEINVDDSEIKKFIEEDSHIDVIFKNDKFQVKCFPAGAEEVEGRLDGGEKGNIISRQNPQNFEGKTIQVEGLGPVPEMLASLNFDEMKDFVIKAIKDANEQYSPDAIKDVILLINDRHISEGVIERAIDVSDLIKSLGELNFKEIYLVGFKKNIKLYP